MIKRQHSKNVRPLTYFDTGVALGSLAAGLPRHNIDLLQMTKSVHRLTTDDEIDFG